MAGLLKTANLSLYAKLEEVCASREAEILSNKQRLEACDLLCFVYDTSDVNSFGYVASLRVCFTRHTSW